MFLSSIKKWIGKQRNAKYLRKSYCREKLTFSKHLFSKFQKFVSWSVFGELQLTQISLGSETFGKLMSSCFLYNKSNKLYLKRNGIGNTTDAFRKIRNLEVDGCQSNLYVFLKQLLSFYKFYDFFCRRHSLMNQPCYNNLF